MSDMNPSIDWDIQRRPINDGITGDIIPGWQRIVKDKMVVNKQGQLEYPTFHIARKSYNPPTTKEFQENYHEIARITGFEPVGFQEWNNGQRIFGYLKNVNEKFDIDGHEIDDYLLLGVGYGGDTAFFIGSVNKLIRCQNEFGRINRTWKVRNTTGRQLRTKELIAGFEEHIKVRNGLFKTFRHFKQVNIDPDLIVAAKKRIMDMSEEETVADLKKIRKEQYLQLTNAINSEMKDLGQNLWGLFNGATKFTTHCLKKEQQERNVFGNVIAGENRHKKNKLAFDFCKDYLQNEAGIFLATN